MNSRFAIADPISYDISNISFQKPEEKKLANDPKVTYHRIALKSKEGDKEKDLLVVLDKCYCYGIGTKYGYAMGISLEDRDGPTELQTATIKMLEAIADKAKDFLVANKGELNKPKLTKDKLDEIGVVKYRLLKTGEIDTSKPPTMTIKLPVISKDKDGNPLDEAKVVSDFMYESDESPANPMDFIEKPFYVRPVIRVEGIFVGQQIKLQVKLHECMVTPVDNGPRSILKELKAKNQLKPKDTISHMPAGDDEYVPEIEELESGDNRAQLLNDDAEEEEEVEKEVTPPPSPPKKPKERKGVKK